jgi:hypothetical protein
MIQLVMLGAGGLVAATFAVMAAFVFVGAR